MTPSRSRKGLGPALLLLLALGCGYSPKPQSGELRCSTANTCPDGFECVEGACWSPNFFGTWTFTGAATRRIACDGGAATTEPWGGIGEFFEVMKGGSAALSTYYYCDWDLDLAAGGGSTVIKPGEACSGTDPADPTTMYTWHGESFTLSSGDGKTGTIDASLPYDYVTLTGSGSCTMKFTGPVTKS